MSAYNKLSKMLSPSTNARTCPYCGTDYEPMPGNRGYEQVYCTPKCRRAEHRRREAMRLRGEPITAPAPRPSVAPAPRTAPAPSPVGVLESQDGNAPDWVYDLWDDLAKANWDALRWRRRYELAKETYDRDMVHVVGVLERIVD